MGKNWTWGHYRCKYRFRIKIRYLVNTPIQYNIYETTRIIDKIQLQSNNYINKLMITT